MQIPKKSSDPPKRIQDTDDLVVKRKGGGSIIDHRPLFSNDGEALYVLWGQLIRVYSSQTGDFVQEFEPAENKLVDIVIYEGNTSVIVGCTENGDLVQWNIQNGLITKKSKLKIHENAKIKTFHIVKYINAKEDHVCQILVTYNIKIHNAIQLILFDMETGDGVKSISINAVSADYDVDIIGNYGDNLIALVHYEDLHILLPARNLWGKIHKIGFGGRKFTRVAGHPDEECVATGDTSGRVAIWKNLHNRPIIGNYHWHTLPVTDLAFSKSGNYIYTGGSECVLVKWIVGNPHQKSFLPRLPAPIKHLTIAPDNLYIAVSTLDNGIIVVDPQKKVTSVIQNFTWGVGTSLEDLFPAGLILDPRTRSLVLNSRTGYVQFFDTHTKSLLYNINITAQNLLTQTRNGMIVNTEVTKIALNHDGLWMATVEERNDKISNPEVRLKFWKYDTEKQIFSLNTSIELPHDNGVNAIQFQPNTALNGGNSLAVTAGKDNKFKLWNLAESSSIHDEIKHWACYGVGTYRDLPTYDVGFAIDGSLLGISFGSSLTIWSPESVKLKCCLTHNHYTQTIKRVEFGKHDVFHLVVVASSEHIAVWNLLTLNMMWSVPLKFSTLAADPNSCYMAAFTTDDMLFVFTPHSSNPVYKRNKILGDGGMILGATFVPHLHEKRVVGLKHWQRKSQLYFLDSNQELLTLESESEVAMSLESLIINSRLPATAFSSLIAAKTTSNIERFTPFLHDHFGTSSGKGVVSELLTVSAHTLPPMRMLYEPFLLSLRAQNAHKIKVQDEISLRQMNGSLNDSVNDSDDEDMSKVLNKNLPANEIKLNIQDDESESNQFFDSYDWSFLASVVSNETL
ncbi:hypothetical protein PV327_007392 [Microctonus hyperodae]|uniref:WD repeat-containing protein 75 second beta-propeller domain-containing protein n=1 Tax=Microctonus hyperodae TaxID=165561 RepID=A0AA39FZJ1_MICHY|nr:hypothetical protein PV327_007392 [Microctonus hyperodae]